MFLFWHSQRSSRSEILTRLRPVQKILIKLVDLTDYYRHLHSPFVCS